MSTTGITWCVSANQSDSKIFIQSNWITEAKYNCNNPQNSLHSVITILVSVCFPSVELQKANLEAQNSPSTGGSSQSSTAASPLASAIPLAQLLAKPGPSTRWPASVRWVVLPSCWALKQVPLLSRPPESIVPTRIILHDFGHLEVVEVPQKAPNWRAKETSLIRIRLNEYIFHIRYTARSWVCYFDFYIMYTQVFTFILYAWHGTFL